MAIFTKQFHILGGSSHLRSKLRKGFGAVYFKLESKAAIAASAAAEEAGSTAQHVAEVSARAAGVAAQETSKVCHCHVHSPWMSPSPVWNPGS